MGAGNPGTRQSRTNPTLLHTSHPAASSAVPESEKHEIDNRVTVIQVPPLLVIPLIRGGDDLFSFVSKS